MGNVGSSSAFLSCGVSAEHNSWLDSYSLPAVPSIRTWFLNFYHNMVSGENGYILESSFFVFNSAQEKYILGKRYYWFFFLEYIFLFEGDKYYILAQSIYFSSLVCSLCVFVLLKTLITNFFLPRLRSATLVQINHSLFYQNDEL